MQLIYIYIYYEHKKNSELSNLLTKYNAHPCIKIILTSGRKNMAVSIHYSLSILKLDTNVHAILSLISAYINIYIRHT